MISNCPGCKMQSKDPEKDRTSLENGYYIVSKIYKTTMNPNGVIMGSFDDLEMAKTNYKKFTFLRRLIDPRLVKCVDNKIEKVL